MLLELYHFHNFSVSYIVIFRLSAINPDKEIQPTASLGVTKELTFYKNFACLSLLQEHRNSIHSWYTFASGPIFIEFSKRVLPSVLLL